MIGSFFKKSRFIITVCLGIAACKGNQAPPPPTPTAVVSKPVEYTVVEQDDYPGRLVSPQTANVSARVTGLIEQANFNEGSLVQKGDVLFVIDPRSFAADLKNAEAQVGRAASQANLAEAHFRRFDKLKGTQAISAEDYDEALSSLKQARANVAAAEAQRDVSKLSLEWTKVLAPISGKVSRKFVTEGNIVSGGTGQGTLLTTITSIDPMYCYVNVPEQVFLKFQKFGTVSGARQQAWLKLSNENNFGHEGYVDFIDTKVDPTTGTTELRGVFPNGDGRLVPGLFARMRVAGSLPYTAILLPEIAIGATQDSRFVLTVSPDNTIVSKNVKLGAQFGSFRAIQEGLTRDDRVVMTGIQQLRPGTKVQVDEKPIVTDPLKEFAPQQPTKAP